MTLRIGQPAFLISGSLAAPAIFEVQVTGVFSHVVRIVDAIGPRTVSTNCVFETRELARLALIKVGALGAA